MNERIKELMGKTLDDKFSHTWDTMTHEGLLQFSEKFAELIVRECCQVLEQTQTALDRHKWPTPSECGVYIKEHFGVEE